MVLLSCNILTVENNMTQIGKKWLGHRWLRYILRSAYVDRERMNEQKRNLFTVVKDCSGLDFSASRYQELSNPPDPNRLKVQ